MIKIHKKIKKAILYGKNNFNNAKYYGINMMSQINAPIYSCKNPRIYYQNGFQNFNEKRPRLFSANTKRYLAVQPNHESAGVPNPSTSFEYNLLSNIDVKLMKTCTIVLICMMTLALKVLAMFTLSMGILIFESTIFVHGWMPVHVALVTTQWLAITVILMYMVIKTKRAYYKLIMNNKQ